MLFVGSLSESSTRDVMTSEVVSDVMELLGYWQPLSAQVLVPMEGYKYGLFVKSWHTHLSEKVTVQPAHDLWVSKRIMASSHLDIVL